MTPKVFDLILRTEIQAQDEVDALRKLERDIKNHGIENVGLRYGVEVIRDDSLSQTGKDDFSRHVNGYAILTSQQQQMLVGMIDRALQDASRGDMQVGTNLLRDLQKGFDYLTNSGVTGVEIRE